MSANAGAVPVGMFAARVLAIGAMIFVAWIATAQPLSAASGAAAARLLAWSLPARQVDAQSANGSVTFLIVIDEETIRQRRLPPGMTLEMTVDSRLYTCGIVFFLALLMASWPRRLAWKAAGGCALILLVAAVSVSLDACMQLSRIAGPGGESVLAVSWNAREAIALGYQLSVLALPTLVPIALWLACDRRFVPSRLLPAPSAHNPT